MKRYRNAIQAWMRSPVHSLSAQEGKMGYILLWALGVPIPLLLVIYLLRGCS